MSGVDDTTTDISYTLMKSEEPPPAAAIFTPISKPAPVSTPDPVSKPAPNQILAQPVPIPQLVNDVLLFLPGQKNWNYCKSFDAISRGTLTLLLFINCVVMGHAVFDDSRPGNSYNNDEIIKHSYLACTSILFLIQLVKLFLNFINSGDLNLNLIGFPRVLTTFLIIFEHFFFLGMVFALAISFATNMFADSLGVNSLSFASGFVLGIVILIYRAIMGCTECCYKTKKLGYPELDAIIVIQK